MTRDGAAGFNFMEMQSAARAGLKVTTVVFADASWTMEEPNKPMLYGRTFMLPGPRSCGCRQFYNPSTSRMP